MEHLRCRYVVKKASWYRIYLHQDNVEYNQKIESLVVKRQAFKIFHGKILTIRILIILNSLIFSIGIYGLEGWHCYNIEIVIYSQ